MSITPISIARGSTLFDGSARDLHGKLCKFYQSDDNGNELDVEGFFEDTGSAERNKGIINLYLPGDKQISYLDTSQGRVVILLLGNARVLDERIIDGEPRPGEIMKICSIERPATSKEIKAAVEQTAIGLACRAKAIINSHVRIYAGIISAVKDDEIVFSLNSGSKCRLPLNGISELSIRQISKVKLV